MPKKKLNKITNYVIMISNQFDSKHSSLKEARTYMRSLININEVKGLDVVVDIFKETTSLKKLPNLINQQYDYGTVDQVFKEFQ